jgi:predicted transcriptional regulator
VKKVLRALFDAGVVQRKKDGRSYQYALDEEFLERRIEVAEQQLNG